MTQSDLATLLTLLEGLTLTPSEASEVLAAMKIGTATTDVNVIGNPTTAISGLTVVHAPPVILDLPVTTVEVDGQTIYQKTYKNTNFKVPKEDSREGPFYIITKGYRIGIIDDWGIASDAVTSMGGATYCKVDTMHAGLLKMLKAIDNKATVVIKK
ncbi:hypothetical protein V8E55_006644 [Tylopilus felleus]